MITFLYLVLLVTPLAQKWFVEQQENLGEYIDFLTRHIEIDDNEKNVVLSCMWKSKLKFGMIVISR